MGKKQPLQCCIGCGRDTRSKAALCAVCLKKYGDSKCGPKVLRASVNESEWEDDGDECYLPECDRNYHGDTERDDL